MSGNVGACSTTHRCARAGCADSSHGAARRWWAGSRRSWTRRMPPGGSPRLLCSASSSAPATLKQRGRCSMRSEEHTSELQSRFDLVCRLLLEKKKQELDANKYDTQVDGIARLTRDP